MQRIREPSVSVGHCYNLVDIRSRTILNIETASGNRMSVYEVGPTPFFHANMYLHLPIKQVGVLFFHTHVHARVHIIYYLRCSYRAFALFEGTR